MIRGKVLPLIFFFPSFISIDFSYVFLIFPLFFHAQCWDSKIFAWALGNSSKEVCNSLGQQLKENLDGLGFLGQIGQRTPGALELLAPLILLREGTTTQQL